MDSNIPYRNVPERASTDGYLAKLLAFLDLHLPNFPQARQVSAGQSENDLTQALFTYLARKVRFNHEGVEYPFVFQTESPQRPHGQRGHPKRADLAASLNTAAIDMTLIYCIEAKKLPTDRPGSKREMEYVVGKGGGIERFKNGSHGRDETGQLLPQSGMIAYITDAGFDYWHQQINAWINTCGWPATEHLLKQPLAKGMYKLSSNHPRMEGGPVRLTHFWLMIGRA